jgi:hypothetical protein
MVSTIILSFLLDRGFTLLRQAGKDKFGADNFFTDQLRSLLIGEMVANIIFILALFGLAWLVLLRFNKDVLIAWIFILVGFICMLYLPLVLGGPPGLQGFLTSSGFGVMTRGFQATLMENGFGTYFGLGSSGVLIMGILGLFRGETF